ncbi:hypothetical protein YH63_014385 [Afipia massiliensis]|uniref:Uncharacterized protein n=1 Tax=Afipia massiliensis TaxID=211460 RepID=A0A4U6BPT8_9BRAD|nr:hypothetical protein YH63_014385 [Afipia massiliensis]
MGNFSIWHWLVVLFVLTPPIPIGKILQKNGRSWAWSLLYFVPLVNIIFLWIWAFSDDQKL